MTNNKGYLISVADNSSFYIPDALHIERDDSLMLVKDDDAASRLAEQNGIKLIYGMEGVPDRVYLDTEENRDVIIKMLVKYPEYEKWADHNNELTNQ